MCVWTMFVYIQVLKLFSFQQDMYFKYANLKSIKSLQTDSFQVRAYVFRIMPNIRENLWRPHSWNQCPKSHGRTSLTEISLLFLYTQTFRLLPSVSASHLQVLLDPLLLWNLELPPPTQCLILLLSLASSSKSLLYHSWKMRPEKWVNGFSREEQGAKNLGKFPDT